MATMRLIQVDKNNSEFEIKVETKIGRGPVFDISDKKVSRNHAILTPLVQESKIELKSTHVNPCFIQLKGEGKKLVLEKDSSMKLNDGDVFSLLANKHLFKVVSIPTNHVKPGEKGDSVELIKNLTSLEDEEPEDDKLPRKDNVKGNGANESSTSAEKVSLYSDANQVNQESQVNKDLKTEDTDGNKLNGIEDDNNNDDKDGSNKLSISDEEVKDNNQSFKEESNEEEEKKPPKKKRSCCVFGKKCYRKNEEHKSKYAHPGDSDYDSNPAPDGATSTLICPFGKKCYRKNPIHKKEYIHKPSTSSITQKASTSSSTTQKRASRRKDESSSASSTPSSSQDESMEEVEPSLKRRPSRKTRDRRKQTPPKRDSDEDEDSDESFLVSDEGDVYVVGQDESDESLSDEDDWKPKSKRKKLPPPPPKVKETKKKKKNRWQESDSEVSGEDEMILYDDDESDNDWESD